MGRYYILHDGEVVEEPDHAKWSRWYESSYEPVRCIAATKADYGSISTTFLAMNMDLAKTDPPLLFETRVEGGYLDGQWERYKTLDEANVGHEAWVARVREAERDKPPPPGFVW
ncbi:MAG: hypothetical protein ABIG44_15770 [Planctomycetota bacterium]